MNWETLETFDFKKNKIRRTNSIQQKYNIEKNNKLNYDKYILNHYLTNKLYNLQPNKFPYDLNSNIKHYVLWLHPMIKSKHIYDKKFIYKLLKSMIKNNSFIFYMNSYKNKSIKSIPHYQVFIKL